jgi:hypothetical protein
MKTIPPNGAALVEQARDEEDTAAQLELFSYDDERVNMALSTNFNLDELAILTERSRLFLASVDGWFDQDIYDRWEGVSPSHIRDAASAVASAYEIAPSE